MRLKIISLFFLCLYFTSSFSQLEWEAKKDKISIPFELTHNLIIIDVVVNDVDLKMIFDTGSEKNLLFSFPENDSIEFYNPREIKINGLGYGEELKAIVSTKNKFNLKGLNSDNFEVLLITEYDLSIINKMGIPINGILSTSLFKEYFMQIDYSKKRMIFYKNNVHKRKLKKYKEIAVKISNNRPFLNLEIDKKPLNLLFDTGLGGGLWLFENEKIKCNNNYFIDDIGRGLTGNIKGKKSRVDNLSIQQYNFKDALVSYPDSLSISNLNSLKNRNGSLGSEIIKRFNWILDYNNQIFYLKKNNYYNDPFHYNMSGIEVQHDGIEWVKEISVSEKAYQTVKADEFIFNDRNLRNNYEYNLKPVFIIYSVRENSPAEKIGIKVGDKIIKINNKSTHYMNIQKFTDLFQSEEGKLIKLEVERDGKILKFEFRLEKVL